MPELQPWAQALLAVFIFVVGGGTVGKWLASRFRAGQQAELEQLLDKRYAQTGALDGVEEDLNRWGEKVTGVHRIAELATENAEAALSAAQRAETRIDYLERQILPRLDRMAERLGEQGEALAAQTAVLRTFMDEYRGRK